MLSHDVPQLCARSTPRRDALLGHKWFVARGSPNWDGAILAPFRGTLKQSVTGETVRRRPQREGLDAEVLV